MQAFEPLTNVPVQRVDTVIEVVPRGDGSHASDDVFVTTNLTLLADIDTAREATLILPMATEAQQQPIVRYTGEPITGAQAFAFDPVERAPLDDKVVERLAALANGVTKKEQKALATAIERASAAMSTTVIEVQPGQRQLRLFYSIAADKVADREFEFSVIGPLPTFVIGAGGSIHVTALLARGTALVNAQAYVDPNNPSSQQLPVTPQDLVGRTALAWLWQNDPLFKVRYRY